MKTISKVAIGIVFAAILLAALALAIYASTTQIKETANTTPTPTATPIQTTSPTPAPSPTATQTPTPNATTYPNITINYTGQLATTPFQESSGKWSNFTVKVNITVKNNGYNEGFTVDSSRFILTAGNAGMGAPPKFHATGAWPSVTVPANETYSGNLTFELTGDLEAAFLGTYMYGWYLRYDSSLNIVYNPSIYMY